MLQKTLKTFATLACLLAAVQSFHAQADDYPSRRITLIAPYAAGGGFDGVARILADALGRNLGQSVVVENIEGAGGVIGARQAVRAAPDGYTLLMNHMGMPTAPLLVKNLGFDPMKSFSYIGMFVKSPALLVGRKDLPANTIQDLLKWLKANPDATIASAGVGSGTDLCAMLFEQAINQKLTHVQYRGAGPAMIDLEASRVDLLCETPFGLIPHIRAGAAKPFLVSGDSRLASLPDVPTAGEAGLPDFNLAITWYGLYAPAGTPAAVVDRLSQALQAAVQDPIVLDRMKKLEMSPFPVADATPQALQQFLGKQMAMFKAMFEKAGIQPH